MSLPLDPARIRAEFPAFKQPDLKDFAFFENAGGSYTCAAVLNRMRAYYWNMKVQPYGAFPASRAAGDAMDEAHRRMALALNVAADWIHFGPSTSANTYALARAFEAWLRPADAIVVTNQDHEANSGVWRKLAARGVDVREWKVDPETGHLNVADLDKLMDSKVRLVAMPHVSNIVGEINPVSEVVKRAKAFGAVSVVDGVSYAPHGLPDLLQLGCDIYLFSSYKTYGPHQGIMAVRPSLAAELPNQGHFFNETNTRKRLVPAGPDHAQIAAAAGIVDYLEKVADIAGIGVQGAGTFRIAHNAMRVQEQTLLAPLLDYLRKKNGIRLIGPDDPVKRAPTVSIVLDRPASHVAGMISRHNVGVGGGHFYAWRLLEAVGVNPLHGVLRMSFVHYTTPEEIQRLIAALDAELYSQRMNRTLAAALLLLCALLWGMAFIAQKSAMQYMTPLTFAFVRYFLGAFLVTPLALAEYRRQRARGIVVTAVQWWQIGILSLAFFAGVWLQQAALQTTTVTNGGFLTALYVILTPVVTYVTIRARPHPIVYLGAPLAMLGIYLLTGADVTKFTPGDIMLLVGALCWAVQVALLGQLVKETGLPVFVSAINFYATAVLAMIGAFAFEHPSLGAVGNGWLEIVYSGIFSTGIAFSLQAIGQQYVPSANAAIILSAESLFAAIGGAIFLGERLPALGYFGAAIIFAAIVMVEAIPAIRSRRPIITPGSA